MKALGPTLVAWLALAASAAAIRPNFGVATGARVASTAAPTQPWIEILSWKPRAYLYHQFLSEEECDHIIKVASPHIHRSSVVNNDGSVSDDPIRTSWGTFLTRGQDEVIWAVEQRVANWSHIPAEHAEDMQVLRYKNNQTYGAHWDDLDLDEKPDGLGGGSVRVATVMLYLSDVEEGGETAFPYSRFLDKEVQTAGGRWSECARDVVAVRPRKGDAMLFWDTKVGSMRQDKWSQHAGCPVLKGTKWTGVKWLHAAPFGGPYPDKPLATSSASLEQAERLLQQNQAAKHEPRLVCKDDNQGCGQWAQNGECTKNPGFMRKQCRLSCGVCCPEGDVLCERKRKRIVQVQQQS